MESNEAGGEPNHVVQLCRNKKEEVVDTLTNTCPAPLVGLFEGVFEAGTFVLMMMQGHDDQSQAPPLTS